MKKILLITLLLFCYLNLFADDFWINPKWGIDKKEIESKYKLSDIEIDNLQNHLKFFLDENISSKFKTYLVNGKKYIYGEKEFIVIIGLFDNKLQWIMMATDQLEKNELISKEISDYYPKIFKVDKFLNTGDANHNITKEFCFVSGDVKNNIYYEIQSPLNRDYEQFTYYQMNNKFFKSLKLKSEFKPLKSNEHIITRFKPKEKK